MDIVRLKSCIIILFIGKPPTHLTFYLTSKDDCAIKLNEKLLKHQATIKTDQIETSNSVDKGAITQSNENDRVLTQDSVTLDHGILGLHTCGDLGPILIRLFCQNPSAKFLQSVGCCYMKLQEMFPMSQYLKEQV